MNNKNKITKSSVFQNEAGKNMYDKNAYPSPLTNNINSSNKSNSSQDVSVSLKDVINKLESENKDLKQVKF